MRNDDVCFDYLALTQQAATPGAVIVPFGDTSKPHVIVAADENSVTVGLGNETWIVGYDLLAAQFLLRVELP